MAAAGRCRAAGLGFQLRFSVVSGQCHVPGNPETCVFNSARGSARLVSCAGPRQDCRRRASVLFVRFCYVSAVCHCLSRVLPLGRAFAEAGNVSVRVPVVSSPPEPSQNSSLCLGGSPAVASPSREGDAGDGGWGAGLPSAAAELRYQHHVWGKHGGMFSGRERSRPWFYFGSQRRAKTPGAP